MYICFAEYKIMSEHRESFLTFTKDLLESTTNIRLYEGTDQSNLFVEVWQADTIEEADQIKKERCDERSPWYRISEWIDGGKNKLHVWSFKPAHN